MDRFTCRVYDDDDNDGSGGRGAWWWSPIYPTAVSSFVNNYKNVSLL